MADATTDTARAYEAGVEPIFNNHGLTASKTVYEGSAVFIDASTNLADDFAATGKNFAGFAMSKAVQGTETTVQVRARGIIKLTVKEETGGTPDSGLIDVGDTVYAEDDSTFTVDGTSAVAIGKVHRVESVPNSSTAVCLVYFEAKSLQSV